MDGIIFLRNRGQGKKTWSDCVLEDRGEICSLEDIRSAFSDGFEERSEEAASTRLEGQVCVVNQGQQRRDEKWEMGL